MTKFSKESLKLLFAMVTTCLGVGLVVGFSTFLSQACTSSSSQAAPSSLPTAVGEGMDEINYIFDRELEMCFIRLSEAYGNRAYGYLTYVPCTDKFMAKAKPEVLK